MTLSRSFKCFGRLAPFMQNRMKDVIKGERVQEENGVMTDEMLRCHDNALGRASTVRRREPFQTHPARIHWDNNEYPAGFDGNL